MIYGYARVSTDGQSVDAQVKALRAAGAEKIFRETASGAKTDRAQLRRAIDGLGEGDVLMVTRLDRLARSTRDLLNTLATIAKAGAGFRSLHDAWADTTTAHGRLMLTVLGGLAEFERDLIRAHGRRQGARQGARRPYGATPCPHPASARGRLAGPCQGQGDAGRLGAAVQREPEHDFEVEVAKCPPNMLHPRLDLRPSVVPIAGLLRIKRGSM